MRSGFVTSVDESRASLASTASTLRSPQEQTACEKARRAIQPAHICWRTPPASVADTVGTKPVQASGLPASPPPPPAAPAAGPLPPPASAIGWLPLPAAGAGPLPPVEAAPPLLSRLAIRSSGN